MITKIALVNRPGQCRWCGCTETTPCSNGCSWANRALTLCSECVPLDNAMRTAKGRKALAEFVQINIEADLGLLENPDYARPVSRGTSPTRRQTGGKS